MSLSDFSLENKVALITGGTSGLGKMMALALAKAGAFVWIASSRDNADETLKELKDQGTEGRFIQLDVTSSEALENVVSLIHQESNRIDILVNAAGINLRTSAEDLTLDEWQKTIDINLTAPFHLSQLVADSMRENNWGRIINIASLQSLRAFDNSIPYGASKGGIMQLTRALAQAYSKDGVLVNAIAPGFFRTNLTESLFQDPGKLQTLADKTMMGRNGEEKDIFGISVFLCSDANSYVTGQTIFLDGGFSAA
ncbi:SDR family oxidoreductase [Candidatus Pseudothioglobus singularis]|jgi:gluconate 5-dehydrogenase|uniref:Gluconate 5-dehydrogenase n=1 Tax=Candidatus Pseudothioglobus singularis PS1 TaxID=1125411 RepID=A0A0M4LEA8_9GAMM|nr:SDR family oxidoreductase [Candidatus Pseudothioglobus singularis]MDC3294930.1 SDR family oxidoreductase [bacterium]MDG1955496.1 SDR family oxidoreductase [Candidatus Thioglobus sp.]ALE01318.1 gluconate 5-dehydrogenase [Candidatus Pseudothioglobus singularis PS1]ANQ65978.1 gluconate 5-dehydrogenase [Candidatus Pseudothioglobus singularis]MDA8855011.1 SDR family oxidoreductase [Candidatus Pseudothioglobus singularis]|tara:strand:+ start:1477 stop:2238 length:762 start_codon:yes stop_codon:yes gene_type:complete